MWKTICGFNCFVEDGHIVRCTKLDHKGEDVPAAVYRLSDTYLNTWDRITRPTVSSFRAGFYRGTRTIM